MPRVFTPFQRWLETELSAGRSLTSLALDLGGSLSHLCHIRKGRRRLPRSWLPQAHVITGLSLEDLVDVEGTDGTVIEPKPAFIAEIPAAREVLAPITPAPPAPIPDAIPRPVFEFPVTAERVRVALTAGLPFGPTRAAFLASYEGTQGAIDSGWLDWCAAGAVAAPEPSEPATLSSPVLYDHLKREFNRPDYRPDPTLIAPGVRLLTEK